MADMELRFIHPIDGRIITVDLDGTMLPPEIINELVQAAFLRDGEYALSKKGGDLIDNSTTMVDAGMASGDIIRIIPITSAGGGGETSSRNSRVPAVDASTLKSFSIEDIRQSAAAVTMLVNLYDDLMIKYDKTAEMLDYERSKSRDRLVSTAIMFVSNLLTAVGVSAYSIDVRISYLMILSAVALFMLSAWVTFRR